MDPSSQVQLVEVENISHNWKRFHIAGLVAAALFGIVSGFSLSTLYDDSEPLCGCAILTESTEPGQSGRFAFINGSYIYLMVTPSEGSEGVCSFNEYTFISSFIFACVWMALFLMCGAGGKSHNGLPQPWRIVPPATIFSCVFFFISLGAGTQMSLAFRTFCSTFDKEMAHILKGRIGNSSRSECQDLNLFHSSAGESFLHAVTAMTLAEITGWLCVSSWAFTVGLCLARLFTAPDFRPLVKAVDKVLPERETKHQGYKELTNSPTSSSSSSVERNSFIVTGTSKAEIHAAPIVKDDIIEKEVNTNDVPPDNSSASTMDIRKKHVRLDPDAHIIGD